ncbi:hypothetical protein Trydic_g6945 [Trypoxylus dichotomus]
MQCDVVIPTLLNIDQSFYVRVNHAVHQHLLTAREKCQSVAMSSSGNARPTRPMESPQETKKRSKLVTLLLSCCLFEAVFSACLLAALILLGRHYLYNHTNSNNEIPTNNGNVSEFPNVAQEVKHKINRLPREVIPIHYDITLTPNLESGNMTGRVNITVNIEKPRKTILLNSLNLAINHVHIIRWHGCLMIPIKSITPRKEEEILEIVPQTQLRPGRYYIAIEYSGRMRDKIVGFYQSTYNSESRGLRKMATSKFEPTYARQAYPSFDEPNMKANFTVHLLKPKDDSYIALSNMPQIDEEEVENGILVHFRESVRMSTYLTCFIVSDFTFTRDTLKNGQEFRVYATPEQIGKTEYARITGKSVIDYFIDFFGIDFPLPKLDMAAIPDFVSGAMEHWGLVTYRETALLYSSEISSSANKQRVASVVSHELAHSWFGNLVTMEWWNDIWLNEGFASYIEYRGVDYAEPDWQMMDQFLIDTLHSVLILDATLGSHPIVQTVLTPDEITAIFDSISYNKGASVLRMLEDAIGEEYFRNGVTKYLRDHIYENAVTQDLWDALQATIEEEIDITEFMNTWTMQMGYPVIDVVSDGEETYVLRQRRYLTNPDAQDNTDTPYNYRWTIPITYITSESNIPQYIWFNHTDSEVTIPKPAVEWIKFNYNQVGYYRVNYELEDWQRLIDNVASLSIADKTHLLEEAFRLAESGDISYEIPLNLSLSMKNEIEYIPWTVISTMIGELNAYLASSTVYDDFKNYVRDIIADAYETLTWAEDPDDGHLRRRARVTILTLACKMGHEGCLTQATQRFDGWLNNDEELSQDLRTIVYNYGVAGSNTPSWEQMYDIFVKETDAAEKLKLMHGLTFASDPTLLSRLIDIAETGDVVRSQDYFTLMQYIAANPIGTSIVWDYVRENWEQLVDRFGLNERYLGRMIPSITRTFATNTKLQEMKDFFAKYPDAGAGASARVQALETVENNIKWLEKNTEVVESWLLNYSSAS